MWAEADVTGLTPGALERLAADFGLHHLAVEDALNPRQRPKLEPYDSHLLLVLHELVTDGTTIEAQQLACFIADRVVLVLHHGASGTIEEAQRRLERPPRHPAAPDTAWMVHTLLDAVVDRYEAISAALEDDMAEVEDAAFADPRAPLQRRLFSVKQRLARLRRFALPLGRVVDELVAGDPLPGGDEAIGPHLRDVHDHVARLGAQVQHLDELANAVLDLLRTEQAYAQNEATKRLTAWAAIIAIPTFIASVYGMNFALVPQEGSLTGFWFSLAMMVVIAAGLFAFFKRRRWI